MNLNEANQARTYIKTNYSEKKDELIAELERYISSNDARNSNRITFVSLSHEVRTAIAKTKGKITGKFRN